MPAKLDEITLGALALSPEQRMTLAYRLLVSVEPSVDPGVDAAWEAEITARIARFDAGEAQTVPAEEVFASLREITSGE